MDVSRVAVDGDRLEVTLRQGGSETVLVYRGDVKSSFSSGSNGSVHVGFHLNPPGEFASRRLNQSPSQG